MLNPGKKTGTQCALDLLDRGYLPLPLSVDFASGLEETGPAEALPIERFTRKAGYGNAISTSAPKRLHS